MRTRNRLLLHRQGAATRVWEIEVEYRVVESS